MDSPQSPTQSNDGRSYEQYETDRAPGTKENLFRDPGQAENDFHPRHAALPELETLDEDDSGAINIRLQKTVPASCEADPAGLANFEEDESVFQLPPKTPSSHNPFAFSRSHILPPSQLFVGTQSSPIRRASPTSSRPSPHNLRPNSLSPNPAAESSPLKARGLRPSSPRHISPSSPQDAASSQQYDELGCLLNASLVEKPWLHKAFGRSAPRGRQKAEPRHAYEPMQKSQERRSTSEKQSYTAVPPDAIDNHDEFSVIDRQIQAKSRRGAATKKPTYVRLGGPGLRHTHSDAVEVPSTARIGKTNPMNGQTKPKSGGEILQDEEDAVADTQQLPNTVSNNESIENEEVTKSEADDEALPNAAVGFPDHEVAGESSGTGREAIPETSPLATKLVRDGTRPPLALPCSLGGQSEASRAACRNSPGFSGQTRISRTATPVSTVDPQAVKDTSFGAQDLDDEVLALRSRSRKQSKVGQANKQLSDYSPEGIEACECGPPPPTTSTRAKRHDEAAETDTRSRENLPMSSIQTASTLTSFASTPRWSESTAAGSAQTPTLGKKRGSFKSALSPSPVRTTERHVKLARLPKPKPRLGGSLRQSTRISRHRSGSRSTDELARSSPSISAFDHSTTATNTSATASARLGWSTTRTMTSTRNSSWRGAAIFASMAFAISFQNKKPGERDEQYVERIGHAKTLERDIKSAGGKILSSGFDELFKIPPVVDATELSSSPALDSGLQLATHSRSLGFTALIADGHSRKVKYMQALALGLPCLAPQWIMACLKKNDIVDWAPYLLCAGQSELLGNAIRSRNLTPYDALAAQLTQVLDFRSRLLESNSILLVMTKSDENKKMAYVFLARVLGASLHRVHSVHEAKTRIKAAEDEGRPFDWVYLSDPAQHNEFLASIQGAGSRKRKRASLATEGPALKRIKTLSDEVVIQSLIFGSLVEMEN